MQIEKINYNQFAIILNIEDLKTNNISMHSFMCNSDESKTLFCNILNLANNRIGFKSKNYEIQIQSFAIPSKSSFILLITRIPKTIQLVISKRKYNTLKNKTSFWLKFDSFEKFCMFSKCLSSNTIIKSSLYLLNNCYFLFIKVTYIKNFKKTLLEANEFANHIFNKDFILDENAKTIIKNSALQTARKYFA